jgi:acyl dehydratase
MPAILGAEVGPVHHDIDARWLMAYAAALHEADARYYDTLTAAGPTAHPLFPVCYEWPVAVAMRDRTIPADVQPRSVHATHHLVIHRPPRAGDVTWSESVYVPATLARVYTECARIWNPIHTDVAVARAAGLAAPILHGTATLALAISRVIGHHAGGDASSVGEVSARFTGMVAMPSTLTVRGRGQAADRIGFDVVNEAGAPVLAAGTLRLRPRR